MCDKERIGTSKKFIGVKDKRLENEISNVGRVLLKSEHNRSDCWKLHSVSFSFVLFLYLPQDTGTDPAKGCCTLLKRICGRLDLCGCVMCVASKWSADVRVQARSTFKTTTRSIGILFKHKRRVWRFVSLCQPKTEEGADQWLWFWGRFWRRPRWTEVLPVEDYPEGLVFSSLKRKEITDLNTAFLAVEESQDELHKNRREAVLHTVPLKVSYHPRSKRESRLTRRVTSINKIVFHHSLNYLRAM